jgi:predicted PurR-regulated permease PerM
MPTSRFSTWTFLVCLIISLILVAHLLFGFLTPVAVALVIVSLFGHVHRRLLYLCKGKEYLAAGLATLMVFLLVLTPLSIFLLILTQQGMVLLGLMENMGPTTHLANLMDALKQHIITINSYLRHINMFISPERAKNLVENLLNQAGMWLYDSMGLIASNLLSLVFNFLLTIALVFVFFVSGRATKNFIMELIPIPDEEKERLVKRFKELSAAVFVGNGLISVSEGILGGLAFMACGLNGALVAGVLMSITAFLPLIGAFVVILPVSAFLLLNNNALAATLFLLFNAIQVFILDMMVKPRLIGTKSQMHAALVFMSIIAGVQIYGVIGLFYGPLLVTVFLTLAEIYKEHYRDGLLKQ